eukprot:1032798-Pleurochrysis_carterae.AAC.5
MQRDAATLLNLPAEFASPRPQLTQREQQHQLRKRQARCQRLIRRGGAHEGQLLVQKKMMCNTAKAKRANGATGKSRVKKSLEFVPIPDGYKLALGKRVKMKYYDNKKAPDGCLGCKRYNYAGIFHDIEGDKLYTVEYCNGAVEKGIKRASMRVLLYEAAAACARINPPSLVLALLCVIFCAAVYLAPFYTLRPRFLYLASQLPFECCAIHLAFPACFRCLSAVRGNRISNAFSMLRCVKAAFQLEPLMGLMDILW